MARKKYQHYTDEFRREAVIRADQPGHTASSVAKELGIHPGQIYNWRRQFTRLSEKQFNSLNGVDYSKPENDEIRQLKRERDALKKELEFVQNAVDGWPPPYFASQHD
ncbi:transposase [Marinobacterium sp. BA1]|uniref:transposase n=1 Tax=Marinobacterium sp. BA1 TaxID=3138931 RepID=UPI0032E5B967